VVISKGATKIFGSKVLENITKDQKTIEIPFQSILPLVGDIRVEFYHKEKFKKVRIFLLVYFWYQPFSSPILPQPAKMFHFWFNTFFMPKQELVLQKSEIDKANKDKKHSTYDADFKVTLEIVTMNEEIDTSLSRYCRLVIYFFFFFFFLGSHVMILQQNELP